MKFLEPGQEIETTVVAVSADSIFLDLNMKSEGVADRAEFTDADGKLTVKEGDTVKVFFMGDKNGEMRFTAKISGDKADKTVLENAYKSGIPVEGHVEKEIKGGFEIKIGTSRAFCPYSQMGFRQKESPDFYIGKSLPFKIQEYKENGRNILVSNRVMGEESYEENLAKLQETLKVGSTVAGVIEAVQSYGAFVDIGGFRALLPVSEISHSRVADIRSVLSEGQKIEAQIIKLDWNNERISLSLKALERDPWDDVVRKYPADSKHEGAVSRIAEFGLFVALEPGVDGLVHVSELEDANRNTNLRKLYKIGDKLSVVVKAVDAEQKRLSLKPAASSEQDSSAAKYLKNQDDSDTYNPFAALLKK